MPVGGDSGGSLAVIIGAPGAGKSSAGQIVAARLGVPFRDTDAGVERATGTTISDIFLNSGEAAFRSLERAEVARALREDAGILSLGGGAIMDPATRADLAGRFVVWLRVCPATAARRIGLSAPRPVLLGNVRGKLAELLEQRTPLYARAASLVIDTDELTSEQVADVIVDALRDRMGWTSEAAERGAHDA